MCVCLCGVRVSVWCVCVCVIRNKGRISNGRNREERIAILPEKITHIHSEGKEKKILWE